MLEAVFGVGFEISVNESVNYVVWTGIGDLA